MDSLTYIKDAIRTESVPESIQMNQATLAGVLKIAEITAKLVDQVKRQIFYGKPIDHMTFAQLAQNLSAGAGVVAYAAAEGLDINVRMPNFDEMNTNLDIDLINIRLLHAALGCFTESGELIEAIYNQFDSKPFDMVNFGEEIGDIEWYQAIGFDASGVTEASCREKNIAKLRARYPDKFDSEQAVNRDLEAERKTLE